MIDMPELKNVVREVFTEMTSWASRSWEADGWGEGEWSTYGWKGQASSSEADRRSTEAVPKARQEDAEQKGGDDDDGWQHDDPWAKGRREGGRGRSEGQDKDSDRWASGRDKDKDSDKWTSRRDEEWSSGWSSKDWSSDGDWGSGTWWSSDRRADGSGVSWWSRRRIGCSWACLGAVLGLS